MIRAVLLLILITILVPILLFFVSRANVSKTISGAPPYDADGASIIDELSNVSEIVNWKRPDGPLRVGLQVGHWKSNELPEELERLRGNTGSSGYGKSEWEVNHKIAEETAVLLAKEGIAVDTLPATVPPNYWADVFIAIHADGNLDKSKTGFKIATPRRDPTGRATKILDKIRIEYGKATNLSWDEEGISRNMRGYYAFSWRRFEHSVHPMTPSVILETGFLTNNSDAKLLVDSPQIPAGAVAKAVIEFLKENPPV